MSAPGRWVEILPFLFLQLSKPCNKLSFSVLHQCLPFFGVLVQVAGSDLQNPGDWVWVVKHAAKELLTMKKGQNMPFMG
jgi:hypothetical protein